MSQICWLASYMKSGNTWLRIFLNNLRSDYNQPADINHLLHEPIATAREVFDDLMGVEASDLTFDEIEEYRPRVYRFMASCSPDMLFLKIHDIYDHSRNGTPIVPTDATFGAIYILRNPFDVSVSLAKFWGKPVDEIIEIMNNDMTAFEANRHRLCHQLPLRVSSWSRHVASWVDSSPFPVHVVRYEDMLQNPGPTFTAVARFACITDDAEHINRAIRFSDFDVLRQQEKLHDFKERPRSATRFFRKGKAGAWRDELTDAQIERLINNHRPMLQRFGYLSDAEHILC